MLCSGAAFGPHASVGATVAPALRRLPRAGLPRASRARGTMRHVTRERGSEHTTETIRLARVETRRVRRRSLAELVPIHTRTNVQRPKRARSGASWKLQRASRASTTLCLVASHFGFPRAPRPRHVSASGFVATAPWCRPHCATSHMSVVTFSSRRHQLPSSSSAGSCPCAARRSSIVGVAHRLPGRLRSAQVRSGKVPGSARWPSRPPPRSRARRRRPPTRPPACECQF